MIIDIYVETKVSESDLNSFLYSLSPAEFRWRPATAAIACLRRDTGKENDCTQTSATMKSTNLLSVFDT